VVTIAGHVSDAWAYRPIGLTRGHSYKLSKRVHTIDATKFYFTNRFVNVWNWLPNFFVASPTVAMFKKRLLDIDFN